MSEDTVDKIDAWLKATGTAEYRLGLLACANPRAIARIRSGTARIETMDAVLQYIADNPAKGFGNRGAR